MAQDSLAVTAVAAAAALAPSASGPPAAEDVPVLAVTKVSGGQLSAHPPVFTADSEYFLCAAASQINLFSVQTAQLVRTLSPQNHENSHTRNVTSIILNPMNTLQVYSASLDGSIRLWDINDGALLSLWHVDMPISHLKLHPTNPNIVYFMTNKPSDKSTHAGDNTQQHVVFKINSLMYTYNLQESKALRILKARYTSGFDISPDGQFIAVAARYKLHVGQVTDPTHVPRWTVLVSDKKLVNVAWHPTQVSVATGDENGRIKIWHGLQQFFSGDNAADGAQVKDPVVTTLHWHAKRVNHITFSNDGEYLLSGGDEGVLVVWHVASGRKQFLPRLASEILSITISPDMGLFALAQLDNSIRIISAISFVVQQAVMGLQFGSNTRRVLDGSGAAAKKRRLPQITVEPRNSNIVLNGTPGAIQFYNAITDRHIGDLQVAPQNNVLSTAAGKPLSVPRVHHTAFDGTGSWLATVDSRTHGGDKDFSNVALRIWWFDASAQEYVLNTKVNAPHGMDKVHAVAFRAGVTWDDAMLVTAGADGLFKIWEVYRAIERVQTAAAPTGKAAKRVAVTEKATWKWRCRSSGYFRDLAPESVAWSDDGSLLAVSFGHMITLWDPATMSLQHVLSVPTYARVRRLAFGSAKCPYLLSATSGGIYVWNLLTLSIAWSYAVRWTALAFCKRRDQYAVTVEQSGDETGTRLIVFKAHSPVPLLIQNLPESILAMAYLPYSSSSINLVYLTSDNSLKLLSPPQSLSSSASPAKAGGATVPPTPTSATAPRNTKLFSSLYKEPAAPKSKAEGVTAATAVVSDKVGRVAVEHPSLQLLDAPAHVIPPIHAIYETFMTGWLKPSAAAEPSPSEHEEPEGPPAQQETDKSVDTDDLVVDESAEQARQAMQDVAQLVDRLFI
ncbi:NET1-associated nuclear protein 1 [Sorochytrium milnesiophthora]